MKVREVNGNQSIKEVIIMGKLYREMSGNEGKAPCQTMREFCQRPGRVDDKGNTVYFTEQAHKDACDVNKIVRKYDKTGLISHVSKIEAQFGDVTGVDFKDAMDLITNANFMFDQLPADIRKRFNNDPRYLLTFMEDENNRDEAIALGIIDARWTPETDGLGEHIAEGDNVDIVDDKTAVP